MNMASMCFKPRHAKYQQSSAMGTFSNVWVNGGDRKNVHFSVEN